MKMVEPPLFKHNYPYCKIAFYIMSCFACQPSWQKSPNKLFMKDNTAPLCWKNNSWAMLLFLKDRTRSHTDMLYVCILNEWIVTLSCIYTCCIKVSAPQVCVCHLMNYSWEREKERERERERDRDKETVRQRKENKKFLLPNYVRTYTYLTLLS